MSAIVSIGTRAVDAPLNNALVSFAVALPITLFSFTLAYLRTAIVFALFLSWAGEVTVGYGIYSTLLHTDQQASQAFMIAALVANIIFVNVASNEIRRRRR